MQSFIAIAHSYPKLYRGGGIRPPPSQKSSKKPILNRVKENTTNILTFHRKLENELMKRKENFQM